jgi:hypothetical protein
MRVSDPDIGAIERSYAGVVPHRKDAKRCAISGVQFRNAPVHLQVVALIHHLNVGPIKSDASRPFAYRKRLVGGVKLRCWWATAAEFVPVHWDGLSSAHLAATHGE